MECAGQVEIDPYCLAVLKKHWPDVKRMEDIHDVKGNEFGPVDLVCGGFPCQPFSTAGKRKGAADDRFLWPEMLRVIAAIRPTYVIGENVAGIVRMALRQVLSDLEGRGYAVQSFIIPACALNAPHRRDRVWIVARNTMGTGAATVKGVRGGPDTDTNGIYKDVVDSLNNGSHCTQRDAAKQGGDGKKNGLPFGDVPDPGGSRTDGGAIFSRSKWWDVEPDVGRVAHGVSARVDRLKCLGNAVVPQIPEIIGKAIMAVENAK
jgi:DNA (cytosine-5)-methyltransferase 1